jgi:tRNA(Ile)-lysidine synthetase-like protein
MASGVLDPALVACVPVGAWAVGVSGGADSVALLSLLRERRDVRCHVVHLDHETRGGASGEDARFVAELGARWGVEYTIVRRGELEREVEGLPANRSARFRALRLELFRRACAAHRLAGVILAHHAGDQAETIFQRLVRGSPPAGLVGMRDRSCVGGLEILRPLLDVRPERLREHLRAIGQAWREDASNVSGEYQRNRVRGVLATRATLAEALRKMGTAMGGLIEWTRGCAPVLSANFALKELGDLPDVLALEAARRWLVERGAPTDELSVGVLGRLVAMARDLGTAARRHFPGGLLVGRRAGLIAVISGPSVHGA